MLFVVNADEFLSVHEELLVAHASEVQQGFTAPGAVFTRLHFFLLSLISLLFVCPLHKPIKLNFSLQEGETSGENKLQG